MLRLICFYQICKGDFCRYSNNEVIFVTGKRDYRFPISIADVAALRAYTNTPTNTGVEEPLQSRLFQLLATASRSLPDTVDEARDTLRWLMNHA